MCLTVYGAAWDGWVTSPKLAFTNEKCKTFKIWNNVLNINQIISMKRPTGNKWNSIYFPKMEFLAVGKVGKLSVANQACRI